MQRRERLTGFFIIFILLTFSAYSNSMNVGGGMGNEINQAKFTYQTSNSAVTTNKNFVTSPEARNISTNKNTAVSNSAVQATKKSKSGQTFNGNQQSVTDNQLNSSRNFTTENKTREKTRENVFPQQQKPLIEQITVHKVKSGETLWEIAHQHGLNIDSLIGANNISNMNSIKPGQEFKILPIKGILYRVSPGESLASIAAKFNLKVSTVMKDNNISDSSKLRIDQKLILRNAKPEFSYQDRLDQKFMYPIQSRITSYYGPRWGRMHEGLDFAAPMGSPIRAVSSGRVVYSGWATGYGKVVIIEHQKGLRTLYAHNSKLLVRAGQSVVKGQTITRSGSTGNSTGPHLHFEVQVNGRPENPLNYLNK